MRLALRLEQEATNPEIVSGPPVHINVCGYPGAGKSSVAALLGFEYLTLWIPRITTRPRRPGEGKNEYRFVTPDEYETMYESGVILPWKDASGLKKVGTVEYKRGTPAPAYWPHPLPGTELILSVFGKVAPELKRRLTPNMMNFFLVGKPWTLLERLAERKQLDCERMRWHWKTIERYRRQKIEINFDHVIDTTDLSPEEVAKQIAAKAGLMPRIKAA